MSVKAVPEVESKAESSQSSDDFQALEEKIYRTIELLKQAREGQAAAERDARRLREQVSGRDEETESLRRELDDGTAEPLPETVTLFHELTDSVAGDAKHGDNKGTNRVV